MSVSLSTRLIAVSNNRGCVDVVEEPLSFPAAGEILVRVNASWLSAGTELQFVRRMRQGLKSQSSELITKHFGYQNSGIVEEVGAEVTRFKPGDRIVCFGANHAFHSNYNTVPQNLCCHLPENVSFEEGCCCNLALTALMAVRRWGPSIGERVLVMGLGTVGQLAGQLSEISGGYAMGWDNLPNRARIARDCGFTAAGCPQENSLEKAAEEFTDGYGFDAAILAIGGDGSEALSQVKKVMKRTPDGHAMGKIVMVGGLTTTCRWGSGMDNLDILSSSRAGPGYHDREWEFGKKEYPSVYVRWTAQENLKLAMRLIAEGRLNVKPLITHRFALQDISEAINLHMDHPDEVVGSVLLMTEKRI